MKIEEAIQILKHLDREYPPEQIYQTINMAITALRSMPEAGEPLILDLLRHMDGEPVWIEDVNRWGLVSIPEAGQFKNSPFVLFRKSGVQFEWLVEDSELTVYSYPPAHIDRSKWEFCLWCKDLQYLPHEMCADVKMPGGSAIGASFCPSCGRPLTEEAWAELERRLKG